jgi:stage V sporulation protein B
MVSGYLISVILARGLGPTDYGVYGVIMSVLVWVEMAASAGIPGILPKLIPQYENQESELEQTAYVLLFTESLVFFFLCWSFAPMLARLFHLPTGTTLLRLAILDLPCSVIYCAYQGVLSGRRRFGALSAGFIVYSLTKLTGILLLWFFLGLSVSGALLVNVLATVGVLVYLVVQIPPTHARPAYPLMMAILRVALPFSLLVGAWQVLVSLDLWSLQSLWTGRGEVIGIYIATLNIARMFSVVPIVIGDTLFPSLSWALARKDEALAQTYIQAATRFVLVVLIPACVLLAQHADAVVQLIYSSAYASGGIYLRLQLIASMLLALLNVFLGNALTAAGIYYQPVGVLLSLISLSLLLNFVLIPPFGAMGAATALVLTTSVGTIVAAVLAYRRFGSLVRLSTVTRVIGAAALMALVGQWIPGTSLWLLLKFGVLLGFYVLLLGLLREITWADLKAFALWQKDRRELV